jgi:acyl-CoA synthetase (AMP-forming)/AMP-acid ligase II
MLQKQTATSHVNEEKISGARTEIFPFWVTGSSRSSRIKRPHIHGTVTLSPRAIVFIEALPRTANGKLVRAALKLP